MTSTVQKIGINIGGSSTDQVRFSTLRDTFFQTDPNTAYSGSTTIKASNLLRDTTLPANSGTQTNPTVPDATENANIVTTTTNWRVSHFQQSVKWYNIVQSETDLNYSIGGQSWNSNLTKNVVKRMKVTGTLGSNNTSTSATFSGSAYNLRIEVSGNIWGYGGAGGGTNGSYPISGESGGSALSVSSTTGRVIVNILGTGKVYGGGGGGEKGTTGANGSGGSCQDYYETGWHCQGNSPGSEKCSSGGYKCQGGWRYCCVTQGGGCAVAWWFVGCCIDYTVAGAPGGAGGNGGPGRGYNYQSGSLGGVTGGSGSGAPTCNNGTIASGATAAQPGETGGSGGDWGNPGGNTNNTGNGGTSGSAISGSNYSVTGTVTSDTVKGSYT